MTRRTPTLLTALATGSVVLLAACGGDDGGPPLSADAEAGRSIYRSSGCASCHGSNRQGGVGPALEGIWGTEIELDDGTTVIADAAYIEQSIRDPRSQIVKGYSLPMPTNNLTDDEIDSIIDFVEAIGPTAAGAEGADG